jgi:hypothetical protein
MDEEKQDRAALCSFMQITHLREANARWQETKGKREGEGQGREEKIGDMKKRSKGEVGGEEKRKGRGGERRRVGREEDVRKTLSNGQRILHQKGTYQ